MQVDMDSVTKLLSDDVIIRVVTVLDISSLSTLELLESNLTRRDVNYALLNGVIEIDKTSLPKNEMLPVSIGTFLVSGDVYYYRYLSSKVHLTELGLHILSSLKSSLDEHEIFERARQMIDSEAIEPPNQLNGPT